MNPEPEKTMARVTEPVHPVDELAELLIDPEVDDEQVPPTT